MPTTIVDDYTIGLKREIVTALEPLFHDDFPIPELRNHVYVGLEYPLTQVSYPAIYITYQASELKNAGVGHYETITSSDGNTQLLKHWFFQGSINFNIIALSPKERDQLGAALINTLAFGDSNDFLKSFKQKVFDHSYVSLQYLQEVIHPGGEQVGDVPWQSELELSYAVNYAIDVFGEFYSDLYSGNLVKVEHVQLYPYVDGQTPHW